MTTEQIAALAGIVGLYLLLAGALIVQSYRLAKRQTLPVEAPPREVTRQQQENDQLRAALSQQQQENDRLREWVRGMHRSLDTLATVAQEAELIARLSLTLPLTSAEDDPEDAPTLVRDA
jgi:small-conductance mechanosensitive channel